MPEALLARSGDAGECAEQRHGRANRLMCVALRCSSYRAGDSRVDEPVSSTADRRRGRRLWAA